jgi:hypothetical protein
MDSINLRRRNKRATSMRSITTDNINQLVDSGMASVTSAL